MNYHLLEIGLIALFVYIFIPKYIPLNFNVQINEDEMKLYSRLYICKLEKERILTQKEVIQIYKNKKIPFVILNPAFFFDKSQYISAIKIGLI